jgi:hypothetical protein
MPQTEKAELTEVRCRGCFRLVGIGRKMAKKEAPIYCDEQCFYDYPVSSTEARDALVEAVYYKGRYTYERLGEMFGFTRARAQQIVAKRDVRKDT